MNRQLIKTGLNVKTTQLGDLVIKGIPREILDNRRSGVIGVLQRWVPGQDGKVWYIKHDNGRIAPYHHEEFELN
jgi:hypothetical protein